MQLSGKRRKSARFPRRTPNRIFPWPRSPALLPHERPTRVENYSTRPARPLVGKGNVIKCYTMNARFGLSTMGSCSEIPACRGPEVLSLVVKVDPISGNEFEQYPYAYPKEYRERVENFSRNFIWQKMTGLITIEFLEVVVDRMFTADEVSSVVDLPSLKELKHRIVQLFLYARDTGRNHWN